MRVDLSRPDNSELDRGRPLPVEALWHWIGSPLVRSAALPFSALNVAVLRLFGAHIGAGVYVKPGLQVKFPWRLEIGDHCWIGERVWIDNMARVVIGSNVCVSQGVYVCTGNHDWSTPNMKLFRRPVVLNDGCWVGAMSTVCPGVTVGEGAVLTAGSVASRSLEPWRVYTGNPAVPIKERVVAAEPQESLHAHSGK